MLVVVGGVSTTWWWLDGFSWQFPVWRRRKENLLVFRYVIPFCFLFFFRFRGLYVVFQTMQFENFTE